MVFSLFFVVIKIKFISIIISKLNIVVCFLWELEIWLVIEIKFVLMNILMIVYFFNINVLIRKVN